MADGDATKRFGGDIAPLGVPVVTAGPSPRRAASAAARPLPHRFSRLLVLAAVLVPMLVTLAGVWLSWRTTWREAERETMHAADIAAEYAKRVFDGLVLRIDRAQELLAGMTDEEIRNREAELHEALGRGGIDRGASAEDRQPYDFVYDRDAFPLVARNIFPVQRHISFASREFNQSLRDPAAPSPQISPVYVGTVTNERFFAVTMRRERTGNGLPDGSYDGVINASIYIESVERALRRLTGSTGGPVLSLLRSDGLVLARTIPVPPGTRVSSASPVLSQMAAGVESQLLVGRSTLDGTRRIAAFRRVAGYPVYTSAALDQAAVLRSWARALPPLLLAGFTASAGLLLLALLVQRQSRALQAANERLEERVARRTAALAESELRLRVAQESGGVGSWDWNIETGALFWSDTCRLIHGLQPGEPVDYTRWMAGVSPEGQAAVQEQVQALLAGQGTAWAVTLRYRRHSDGAERWISARGELLRRPDGAPWRMLGVTIDVTEQRQNEAALRAIEQRASLAIESARLVTWEFDCVRGRTNLSARFAEFVSTSAGPPYDLAADELMALVHPADLAMVQAALEAAFASGSDGVLNYEHRLRAADGSWRWLLVSGAVMERDPATGVATMALGVAQDVTERRLAEDRLRLMAREVDHRAKNALSVVMAAVRLSDRSDPDAFAEAIEGRVAAMARAHGLLAETRWEGAELRALVEAELAGFLATPGSGAAGGPRVEIMGSALQVDAAAAQGFSMVLHELCTNATKYGALSVRCGVVRVELMVDAAAGRMSLCWSENHGPPVKAPEDGGFGTQVINMIVERQLGGEHSRAWRAEGLTLTITVPLDRVRAPVSEV